MTEQDIALLIELPQAKAYEAFTQTEPVALQGLIDMVATHVRGFPGGDVNTPEGREVIRQFAYRVTKSKTFLEAEGKRVADQVKALPKVVDANRRMISEALEQMRDDVRQPLTFWEINEKARVDRHTYNVEVMIRASKENGTLEDLRAALAVVNAITISPEACEEFLDSYQRTHAVAVTYLTGKIAEQEKRDAELIELETLRKEKAERDARDKALADEQARLAREALIREEAAEAARQALLAAQAAPAAQAAAQAQIYPATSMVLDRAEAAQAVSSSAASKALVNRLALADLMEHAMLSENTAKRVVTIIAKGLVRGVKITYPPEAVG